MLRCGGMRSLGIGGLISVSFLAPGTFDLDACVIEREDFEEAASTFIAGVAAFHWVFHG